MKLQLITALLLLQFSAFAQGDSVSIYFPLNNAEIELSASHTIDSVIQHRIFNPGVKLAILGYADYVGDDKYNDSLSTVRAQHVMDYLLTKGFKKEDIRLCTGKGKIDRVPVNGNAGFAPDRRVIIMYGKLADNMVDNIPQLKINEAFTIEGLYFITSTHKVTKESLPALSNLYRLMKKYPKLKIRIEGHICCMYFDRTGSSGIHVNNTFDNQYRLDGYDEGNTPLSLNRAKLVYQFLVDNGIQVSRLSYIGMGETRPEAEAEKTEADRQHSRRVDIRILEK